MFSYFKNRWTLKGLISVTEVTDNEQCDVQKYSLFTRISDYIGWIEAALYA